MGPFVSYCILTQFQKFVGHHKTHVNMNKPPVISNVWSLNLGPHLMAYTVRSTLLVGMCIISFKLANQVFKVMT